MKSYMAIEWDILYSVQRCKINFQLIFLVIYELRETNIFY